LNYRCLPTLDASVTDDAAFRELVESIAKSDQPVYIHCAVGYGRSASVVAAVLIARGIVPDVQAAEKFIRRIRPGVRLHARQRAQVRRIFSNPSPP
jgi:protein-tyrosine phosphatase